MKPNWKKIFFKKKKLSATTLSSYQGLKSSSLLRLSFFHLFLGNEWANNLMKGRKMAQAV